MTAEGFQAYIAGVEFEGVFTALNGNRNGLRTLLRQDNDSTVHFNFRGREFDMVAFLVTVGDTIVDFYCARAGPHVFDSEFKHRALAPLCAQFVDFPLERSGTCKAGCALCGI